MQTVRPCSRITATAGNRGTLHVYSVTKSVISALIGIALDEKLIKDLDSLVGELLARHQAQLTGDMARVTLR
jgi:CubicO group peptidase (beta-lactamase class C family)